MLTGQSSKAMFSLKNNYASSLQFTYYVKNSLDNNELQDKRKVNYSFCNVHDPLQSTIPRIGT